MFLVFMCLNWQLNNFIWKICCFIFIKFYLTKELENNLILTIFRKCWYSLHYLIRNYQQIFIESLLCPRHIFGDYWSFIYLKHDYYWLKYLLHSFLVVCNTYKGQGILKIGKKYIVLSSKAFQIKICYVIKREGQFGRWGHARLLLVSQVIMGRLADLICKWRM